MLDVIRVRAGRSERGTMKDPPRKKDGSWGGVLGGRDLDETQRLGILYGGGSDRWGIA